MSLKKALITKGLISLTFILLSLGCLNQKASVSGFSAETSTLQEVDPYLSCQSLTNDQIFELSKDNPNLVQDGSFEEGHSLGLNKWTTFTSYGPWQSESVGERAIAFEIQKGNTGGILAHDGDSKLELDAHKNSGIEQEVSGLTVGNEYTLSLYYTPRDLNRLNSNSVDVLLNDQVALSLDSPIKAWAKYETTFTASASSVNLKLLATGVSDSFGGLVDSVSLTLNSDDPNPVNLITNQSFEDGFTVTSNNGNWQTYDSITGWSSYLTEDITPRIEIQNGSTIGGIGAFEGSAKVELDSNTKNSNTRLYQDLQTEPGKKYILKYFILQEFKTTLTPTKPQSFGMEV